MEAIELLLSANPRQLPEKEYKITSLSEETGGDVVFKLRALPYNRAAEIKRGNTEDMNIDIILAGVVSPDLRNQALLEKYGAVTPAEMLKKLLLPGELDEIAMRIEQLSGYRLTLTEEVKKN